MAQSSQTTPSPADDDGDESPVPRMRGGSVRAYTNYNPSSDDLAEDLSVENVKKSEETKLRLEEALKASFLFRELEPDQLTTVIDTMKPIKVRKGDIIIRQGDDGDLFYVIYSGTFEATVHHGANEVVMNTYKGSGSFGELALLYNQPRRATVKATSDGMLYSLGRSLFKRIVLTTNYSKRKLYQELINKVTLFQTLTEVEKLKISDVLSTIVFQNGGKIIQQGDTANGMYFVISGCVHITKKVNGQKEEVLVKVIKSGEYFGELALLRDQPRAASAEAVGETKVAFLDEEAFHRLIMTNTLRERMQINADNYL